jgi:hypothetical protein
VNSLILLTATGARPEAFAMCCELMNAQTFRGAVHWIIVDDGETAQRLVTLRRSWSLDIVRPRPFWEPGQNTQARNLLRGLQTIVLNRAVVVIEDDDFYAPEYLETVAGWLDTHELVGERFARYYNVASRRWKNCGNEHHASLCSTAMRGPALLEFQDALKSAPDFIDVNLWDAAARDKRISAQLFDTQMTVGIKGLPGRGGIGIGHNPAFGEHDPDGAVLREWVGAEQAQRYFEVIA